MSKVKILAFAGSSRKESLNKKLARAAAKGAEQAGAEVQFIDLADYPLPIFCEDLEKEEGIPENAKKIREMMKESQGWILACPEYNGSITPLLKNVIDWASRPVPDEAPLACFSGKVIALYAASPGAFGGMRGLASMRILLSGIGAVVLPKTLALPGAHKLFDEEGNLKEVVAVHGLAANLVENTKKLHS